MRGAGYSTNGGGGGSHQIWPRDKDGEQVRVWCDMRHGGKTYYVAKDLAELSTPPTLAELRAVCTNVSAAMVRATAPPVVPPHRLPAAR
jgi:hypothetical protein